MNIFIYVSLVTFLGVLIAVLVGQRMVHLKGSSAITACVGVSVGIGIGLAFPMLYIVSGACYALHIADKKCIATDDHTVWLLAVPLVAFPAYVIVMLVAREFRKKAPA